MKDNRMKGDKAIDIEIIANCWSEKHIIFTSEAIAEIEQLQNYIRGLGTVAERELNGKDSNKD